MIEDSGKLRALAWRLLALEGAGGDDPTRLADGADKVCQKLHDRLAMVIGQGGFSAILEHALRQTRAEFPFLPVDLTDSPCLQGVQESVLDKEPSLVRGALTALVANFLGSLVSLIGRNLADNFLRSVWPETEIDW